MNLELVEKIANAVLYEGYILYPYRPSATKNQQRWNFGALYPQKFSEAQKGTDACTMQTECLVLGDERTTIDVKVRFLHLLTREVCEVNVGAGFVPARNEQQIQDQMTAKHGQEQALPRQESLRVVGSLKVNGQLFQTWQEAVEREVGLSFELSEGVGQTREQPFDFPTNQEREVLRDEDNKIAGVIVRKQEAIEGRIEVRVGDTLRVEGAKRLFKITIRILNSTPFEDANNRKREEALMRAFVSTHTILNVRDGEFVSLLEPPDEFAEIAAACQNIGTYPVLIGDAGERDCVLSSPIILYDYPQVSPESAGDFFDGTEIDEMLTLRILTLTDDEKHEMRGADERTRRMLERTETMPPEQMMKLHGALRNLRPPPKENEQ